MILLDTNVFIYLANATLPKITKRNDLAFASITRIEALGYSQITVAEQNYLKALFHECEQFTLEEAIIQQAITLRQQSKMTLGYSMIAATALVYTYKLWTANATDLTHIENLRIHNPLR